MVIWGPAVTSTAVAVFVLIAVTYFEGINSSGNGAVSQTWSEVRRVVEADTNPNIGPNTAAHLECEQQYS